MPDVRTPRRRWRRALLAAIAVLYALSIPWYRESGAEPALWLGLPAWVTVALGCYAAIAVLNAFAWLLADIDDGRDDARDDRRDGASQAAGAP